MKNINYICIAMTALFSASNTSAAIYNNYSTTETPFDIQLNTGAYNWSGNTATVQSTDTSTTVNHTSSSSSTAIVVEETPAEVGVEGAIDVFNVTTTTTSSHDHTYNDQTARVTYSDSMTSPQTTPETYLLTGSIEKQTGETLYNSNGWLSFDMGLSVSIPGNPGGIDGSLTFEFGSDPESWAFSYTTEFTGLTDNIFLSDSEWLSLENLVYFNAIYSVTGADGTAFDVTNLFLDIYVNSGDDFTFNHTTPVTSETGRELLSHTVIPALQPPVVVPVPAAAWLMLSGLVGLTAVARRRRR